MIDVANQNAANIFGVLHIFSALLPSSAANDNATWPLYTLPDFEHFGSSARELSGALLLAFSPLVEHSKREAWENYSLGHQDWITDGLHVLGNEYYQPGVNRPPRSITPFIYRKTTRSFIPESMEHETYSPVWQMSPAPKETSVINFNLFNQPTFRRLVQFAIFTRQAAISEVIDTELLFGTSAPQKGDDPQSILVLPVFEEVGNVDSTIVGHVIAVIPWGLFFQNVLQENHNGVHAVLRESCGSNFTYNIDGGNATFLGVGDLHDPTYDDMVRSTSFVAYDGDLQAISGLEDDHCEYTLDVYPSAVYQQAYQSSRPVIFTFGVIAVFAFTSLVFVLYDSFVRRRQQKVNSVAVKSNAIVSSLFPEQVRDKLFQDENEEKKKKEAANPFKRSNANNNAFMNAAFDQEGKQSSAKGMNVMNIEDQDDDLLPNPNESAPIADLVSFK